jgi:hypothetical protein
MSEASPPPPPPLDLPPSDLPPPPWFCSWSRNAVFLFCVLFVCFVF